MMGHPDMVDADDAPAPMTVDERAVWVQLVAFVLSTGGYLMVVIPRAIAGPIDQVSWAVPMLWAIGASILGTIVGSIIAAIGSAVGSAARGRDPACDLVSDARDKDIARLGSRATQTVTGLGMLGVLILAMVDADSFWIGNAVFLAGFAGAVVEVIVKIRAYRNGFS